MRNRNIFSGMIATLVGFGLAIAITASAQTNYTGIQPNTPPLAKVYPIVGTAIASNTVILSAGTTNVIIPVSGTTNTYNAPAAGAIASNTNLLTVPVSQFDYVGLTWAFTGTATSTNSLLIFKSFDGGATYEKTASFQYTGIAPGAAGLITNAALDVHGVTTLGFELRSPGTTAPTNVLLELNNKSPRVGTSPQNY